MSTRPTARRVKNTGGPGNSALWKLSSKLLLGLGVVVLFLTLTQCTVKKPQAPTFDTNLTVPVVNRTYPLNELINSIDQNGFKLDSSGNYFFSTTEQIDTVRLDTSNLTTSDISYSVSQQIGAIDIVPPALTPVTLGLSSVAGLAAGLPGDSVILFSFSFDTYSALPAITTFSQVTIATGSIVATVTNNLGVDLDTVIVQVFDVGLSRVIAIDTLPGTLFDGTSDTLLIPLTSQTITSTLAVAVHGHTPGGKVLSVSTKNMTTGLTFESGLQVKSAVAEIPSLTRSFSQQVPLAESNRIDTASLSAGSLDLTINNATDLLCTLTVSVPDIYVSGSPLSIVREVPARQNTVVAVSLVGAQLIPGDLILPQELSIGVDVNVPGTAPQQVTVNQTDSFLVYAALTSLAFGSVTGVFDSTAASFDAVQQQVDVPTGFDSLEFASAILSLEVANGTNLPGVIDIVLSGNNGKQLNLTGNVTAGSPANPATSTLIDSTVASFLAPIPSLITVTGTVSFGDGVSIGTITANDFVAGQIKITAPLELIIRESKIETDIASEEIDQADISIITDHVIEGRLAYNIINHLPLGASVTIFLGPDSATLFSNPQLTIDSLGVIPAPVSASGIVIDTASTGIQTVILDSLDLKVLENDTVYVGQEITLAGSGGQTVKLTQNDYITVQASIEVDYRFDGDF